MSNVNTNTLGSVAHILKANGYAPVATDRTFGFMSADEPAAILTVPGYQSQCGLADYDKRRVIAIAVIARDTRSTEGRATALQLARGHILKVLAAHGIGKGPVRVASDGVEYHIVRWDSPEVPLALMTDKLPDEDEPAAAVISQVPDATGKMQPALIPAGRSACPP
jgi:hypothetical protein